MAKFFDLPQIRSAENLKCPYCNRIFEYGGLDVLDYLNDLSRVKVKCCSCNQNFEFKLPELEKPLIFLDQWFVSDIFRSNLPKYDNFERIVNKLEKLKFIQRLVVASSDIDAIETSQIPSAHIGKSKAIWSKVIDLSESHILFVIDLLRRQVESSLDIAPRTQFIIDKYRKNWIIGIGKHRMRLLMTKTWLVEMEKNTENLSNDDKFLEILDQQSQRLELQQHKNFESALWIVKDLCQKEIIDAIKIVSLELLKNSIEVSDTGFKRYMEITKEISKLNSGYANLIREVIINTHSSSIEHSRNLLNRLSLLIETDVHDISEYFEIENYLWAERLLHYYENQHKKEKTSTSLKNTRARYGFSRMNDIKRVAAALPYASVLLVDQDMERVLSGSYLCRIRKKYSQCKVFSSASMDGLETWLDEIMQSQEASDELRIIRRLLCGLSPVEEEQENEKMVQEIIDKFLAGNVQTRASNRVQSQ